MSETNEISQWVDSIRSPTYSVVGLDAFKVGRTTGWTRGEIEGTCETHVLAAPSSDDILVRCLDRVEGASAGWGDSGGPVWLSPSWPVAPLGILVGAGGVNELLPVPHCVEPSGYDCVFVYSPFYVINSHLLRTFDPSPPMLVSIVGPDEVQENVSCSWTAAVTNGSAPYAYEWRRDGQLVSTSSTYQTSDTGTSDFQLVLFVEDAENDEASDQLQITVEGWGQFQCSGV